MLQKRYDCDTGRYGFVLNGVSWSHPRVMLGLGRRNAVVSSARASSMATWPANSEGLLALNLSWASRQVIARGGVAASATHPAASRKPPHKRQFWRCMLSSSDISNEPRTTGT